jgi:hypothetical protein
MQPTLRYMPILAGTLAMAGFAGTANAVTEMNMGGSSAGKQFATDVPLNLCDAAPIPDRYSSADNNKVTWVCKRGGLDIILRYSATGSSDGVNKILATTGTPASKMDYLDHLLTTGCSGPTLTTRASDGKQYNNTINCNNGNITNLPTHMGASDVAGSSFHQVGPVGTFVNPLDDTTLNSVPTAIVPFSLFAAKGVVKLNATGTGPNGPIDGLSRLQIEQIFARAVTDWRQLGFGTVTDAAPGTLEATSPILLCQRNAGSGTKATFDETVMINTTEFAVAIPTQTIFSSSSSGVLTCLTGNRRSIGYMDSDAVTNFNGGGGSAGLAYAVRIDGGLANDPALTDPKRDLKCGKYAYWAGWRLNRRTTSEGADIDALMAAYVTNAGLQTTIAIIPTGAYWASDEEMFVSKSVDKGPLSWKSGAHPECR